VIGCFWFTHFHPKKSQNNKQFITKYQHALVAAENMLNWNAEVGYS